MAGQAVKRKHGPAGGSRKVLATASQNLSLFSDEDSADETPASQRSASSNSLRQDSLVGSGRSRKLHSSPSTPATNLVSNMRKKLEKQLGEQMGSGKSLGGCHGSETPNMGEEATSPGLAQLRNTPGKSLAEKQQVLVRKHQSAKSRSSQLNVGGGVSIWPEMDSMRLTGTETVTLGGVAVALWVATVQLFHWIHGSVSTRLVHFHGTVTEFRHVHSLVKSKGDGAFKDSILIWHTHFLSLLEEIHTSFEASIGRSSVGYQMSVLLYVLGIGTLLYYLADNMLSKNKLTPWRIKVWVSLLVVLATWTLLAVRLLFQAQALELALENNVRHLNSQLADLVYLPLDLTTYHDVLTYWRTLCLPPTTHGTLSVLGVVYVRDVSYYLQYYSLPVITALLTPVVRLVIALKTVYAVKPH